MLPLRMYWTASMKTRKSHETSVLRLVSSIICKYWATFSFVFWRTKFLRRQAVFLLRHPHSVAHMLFAH